MSYPKISVITPSYNQGEYLEKTIISVLNQKYPNLEYIIIDGGSTDNSVEIIKKYENQLTFWQSKPDNGQSNAINVGFKKATGDILCWLNSDDTFLPGALETVKRTFLECKFDFYYSDIFLIDQYDKVFKRFYAKNTQFKAQVYGHFAIPQPGSFWTKKVFEECGPLNENNKTCMDGEFFMNILKKKGLTIIKGNSPLANFRIHSESLTGSKRNKIQYRKDRNFLIKKYLGESNIFEKYYYKRFYKYFS